ncbi:MAG: NADH-quinone oxidoreductase subunit C [Candidatus Adiutrix sp.]|jgi:NADH-quinone oxidoreductase subunit C|nr:NADH-quinone oxidoreductase subunit C [Candidatus Adiutrix sp.]
MSGERFLETWRRLDALVFSRFDFQKTGLKSAVILPPGRVREAAEALLAAGFFLETITAVEVREGLLVTYLYDSPAEPGRLAVRALAARGGRLPSLAPVCPGAEWHEREAADFFGLEFSGHPNPVPLLLPHDFPGPPPLLRTAGENVAALGDLKIFGQAEFFDPAWRALAGPAPEAAP